jgi:acylaminoacyl-peptidase
MTCLRFLASAAAASLLLGAFSANAAPTNTFSARDLANLERVGDPHASPDGKTIVYSQRSTDYAANKGRQSLWLVAADGSSAPVKLKASEGGASHPRWSADGKSIYFMSSRSGSSQVWKTDATGLGATQVTKLALDVGDFRLSPDGKTLAVALAVFTDCKTVACTKDRQNARAAQKNTGVVYDKLFVRHWDEWADGTRNHVFALALDASGLATGDPRDLMPGLDADSPGKPFGGDDDYVFSPDSKTLIFSARLAGRTEPWSTNFDLWSVPVDGSGAPANLTPDNKGEDVGPLFSPDGTKLAWRAMKRAGFEADRLAVMVRDLKTGAVREVDPAFDRGADKLAWTDDGKTLFLTAAEMGRTKLFRLDVKTGKTTALTETGHVSDFDLVKGGVVVLRDGLDGPADLYRLGEKGALKPLTRANADKLEGKTLGAFEQFEFAGWNGETVHGYVMKPAGYQPGKRYPTAFVIHGGPQGSFGDSWSYRWNPQTYAGKGYAVVFIDFHGSTGYGQAFTDSISGHWGDRPLEDLQKGWAAAQAKYDWIDGDRACALGASYGGFMVYWIAGNWSKPFKCLVDHDGVFDNRIMGYATEELWFSEWENGHTTPWENPDNYERFNPVNHVAKWDKPMLVIHSAKDYRIPLEQGLAAFSALQRKGVESQLLTFPDENHWVLKPQNSVQWHDTVEAWLNKWIGTEPSK